MTGVTPELSIIIPAFNEARRISSTLTHIVETLASHELSYEIIVINDGSSDETADIVNTFSQEKHAVKLHSLQENQGKGNAVKTGVFLAQGNALLLYDADGSTPIEEVFSLLLELSDEVPLVIGSRALSSDHTSVQAKPYRKIIGRVFNGIADTVLSLSVADTQCGFKLFKKRVAHYLFSKQTAMRFSFDIELLYIARKSGISIKEVPVNWHHVPGSKVNIVVDSAQMFVSIFKHWYTHRRVSPKDFEDYVSASSDDSSISKICTSS